MTSADTLVSVLPLPQRVPGDALPVPGACNFITFSSSIRGCSSCLLLKLSRLLSVLLFLGFCSDTCRWEV
ncbi:hypothetical protein V6N11_004939 [Hibiscus sabdariffa]|uniref:Uncharacterized protein n=1 Tax=Hibiscus sabdariffa TaxID=183260 RepID=A0ABR2SIF4_9ROSI